MIPKGDVGAFLAKGVVALSASLLVPVAATPCAAQGRTLVAVVRDSSSGKPVSDARVTIADSSGGTITTKASSATGIITFSGLAVGTVNVRIQHLLYNQLSTKWRITEGVTDTLRAFLSTRVMPHIEIAQWNDGPGDPVSAKDSLDILGAVAAELIRGPAPWIFTSRLTRVTEPFQSRIRALWALPVSKPRFSHAKPILPPLASSGLNARVSNLRASPP